MNKRNLVYVLTINAILSLIVSVLSTTEEFSYVEKPFLHIYSAMRGKVAGDSKVIIIDIDQESLKLYGRWPWERKLMARLINLVSKQEPKVIGIPILFINKTREVDDSALKNSIEKAGNVVLGYTKSGEHYPFIYEKESRVRKFEIGFLELIHDHSGEIIGVQPMIQENATRHNAFPFVIAERFDSKLPSLVNYSNYVYRINFYGPRGTFKHVSAEKILSEETSNSLKGKIIIIGAEILPIDEQTLMGRMTKSEVYANGIQNLIDDKGLKFHWALSFILCLLGGTLFFVVLESRKKLFGIILLVAYLLSSHMLFMFKGIVISMPSFLVILLLNFLVVMLLRLRGSE
jgi:CHASE2 domain-containing sensor protein